MSDDLQTTDFPQAVSLDQLLEHLEAPEGLAALESSHRSYRRNALRSLGWLDAHDQPTVAGKLVVQASPPMRARMLRQDVARSPAFRAWMAWAGVEQPDELDVESASEFLRSTGLFSASTVRVRAGTLAAWWRHLFAPAAPPPPVEPPCQGDLFAPATHHRLDHERVAVNEDGRKVAEALDATLLPSRSALAIAGYASLDRMVALIARREGPTRLLVGHEPTPRLATTSRALSRAVRDYWLARDRSVFTPHRVLTAVEALRQGRATARLGARDGKMMHAKLYVGDEGVMVGSSNLTTGGLTRHHEANARLARGSETGRALRDVAEHLWDLGEDWTEGLADLLDDLCPFAPWQEVLGRALRTLLDGAWARRFVPRPREVGLWPHQEAGIHEALHVLHRYDGVMVADATGSGKTRLGSWLFRAAWDSQLRESRAHAATPIVIAPKRVGENWRRELVRADQPHETMSHGQLSATSSESHGQRSHQLTRCSLLMVDEAHNFHRAASNRTQTLRAHGADQAILLTATPINRGARDLLALVQLLDVDGLDDATVELLQRLRRHPRALDDEEVGRLSDLLRGMMVRRTRADLNAWVERSPEAYRLEDTGRVARYPHHTAEFYSLSMHAEDVAHAEAIDRLVGQLTGILRFGETVDGESGASAEEDARKTRQRVRSAASLARYSVRKTLLSSRAALWEHLHGAPRAYGHFDLGDVPDKRANTGGVIPRAEELAGKLPEWKLATRPDDAPAWLFDADEHARVCEQEASVYRRIGHHLEQMSDRRDRAKVDHLRALHDAGHRVLAFDGHIISLVWLQQQLSDLEHVERFTGSLGRARLRQALEWFGRAARIDAAIGLCSDVLSEGVNLQGADTVVHLDTPTVIRIAEQRAGRIDRMDSPHDDVHVWWPEDEGPLQGWLEQLIHERNALVGQLIRSNLITPAEQDELDAEEQTTEASLRELARAADLGLSEVALPAGLFDAFQSIRALHGPAGLVPTEVYEALEGAEADGDLAFVDADSRPWAFVLLRSASGGVPLPLFIDGDTSPTVSTDLDGIARHLRRRLEPTTETLDPDPRLVARWTALLEVIARQEEHLLSRPRREALRVARQVLAAWCSALHLHEDLRVRLHELREALDNPTPDSSVDLRGFTSAWRGVVEPIRREASGDAHTLVRMSDLTDRLVAHDLDEALVTALEESLGRPAALRDRILAAIIGVPSE